MALDINGYSSAFKAFTDFAQQRVNANENAAPLIAALRQALPPGKAIKAVSALLNQETARLVGYPQNRMPYPKSRPS